MFTPADFKTTFWEDFSIADKFWENAIKDTYKRAFEEWKNNVEYITELTIVLNWKCWHYYDEDNFEYSKLYQELWEELDDWCHKNLKGEALTYYFRTTD